MFCCTCPLILLTADNIPPSITCPDDVTRDLPFGNTTVAVALGTPRTSDNCGDDQVVVTNNLAYAPNTDPSFSVGSTTVRWTAIDSAGKSAYCSQTIIVNHGRCGRCIWLAWGRGCRVQLTQCKVLLIHKYMTYTIVRARSQQFCPLTRLVDMHFSRVSSRLHELVSDKSPCG